MSDPIDRMLDAAESGKSIIKNREILHFTYIPNVIFHRDSEQEQVAQSLPTNSKTIQTVQSPCLWKTWNWQNFGC